MMDNYDRLRALQKIKELRKFQWKCELIKCDGGPHAGLPFKHARPNQLAPDGDWLTWFIMAGRGFGKTRTGAQWSILRMLAEPKHRLAIIVPRFADGRDVCVEGESGILSCIPKNRVKSWNRSQGQLTFTNGSQAKIFGTETEKDAETLRGPQHHSVWVEELAKMRYGSLAWDMAMFGLRLGDDPRAVVTTTPKPIKIVRELIGDPTTIVVRGRTVDNAANLPPKQIAYLKGKYDGTKLGRQELDAELLDDTEGALWSQAMINQARISEKELPTLIRTVTAVDPAVTSKLTSDETGIVVAGMAKDSAGVHHFYVLADYSELLSPGEWAANIVHTHFKHHGDRIVAEVNNGGDLVEMALRSAVTKKGDTGRNIPYRKIHATKGKALRAEPVQALYEQGRVHHVGMFGAMEDEMTTWVPESNMDSPNRLDALVYAITDLAGLRGRTLSFTNSNK